MNIDKISDERLFQDHPREDIMRWRRSLQYFHFMRDRGGHNCEGDSFATHFKYKDREDLISKLSRIGVALNTLPEDCIAFDPFKSYSFEDLEKLRFTIGQFKDLEQPKYVDIFDQNAHIWVQANRIEVSVSGTKNDSIYNVSNDDFEVCLILEKEFDKLGWKEILDEDITSQSHRISKEQYPE